MSEKDRESRGRWLMAALLAGMLLVPAVFLLGAWGVRRWAEGRRSDWGPVWPRNMQAYAEAQAMYRRLDWDKDGQLEYAADYTRLNTELDGNGDPIMLIDSAFAGAKGRGGAPKHGYIFREMSTIAGGPVDWEKDFALCGIPAGYGRTGSWTYIVTTDGAVWGQDMGCACFLDDFPADPQGEGWVIAE